MSIEFIRICYGALRFKESIKFGAVTSLTSDWWAVLRYLMAVMDWHSRFVLSWELSNTMEVGFCVEALDSALLIACPEIFNTDQGAQFTAQSFREKLESRSIRISMDGRGRAFDNIFIERLWRSVKYENIYLKDYRDGWEARAGIGNYFVFYNEKRLHSSLGYRTPQEVYFGRETAAKKM